MIPTREQIFAALWARVSAATIGASPAFKTTGRIVRGWDQIPAEDYDCLFMGKGSERIERVRGLDPKTFMTATLYVYVNTNAERDAGATDPAALVNAKLDALDATLAPDTDEKNACTLGGLVSHAWISGEIFVSEGTLGDYEVAIVPVEMLVPALVNQ